MIKAAIFNTYLNTWGGGERSTYAVASTLASLGFDVEVVTYEEKTPSAQEIERFFGPGHGGFRVRSIAPGDESLRKYLADKAIFINHTAGSAFPNPCPLGIYFVMFPFQ